MTADELKSVIKEALAEEIRPFYVDRERHYQHHQFIEELIGWSEKIKGTICGTLAKVITATILGLIFLGFILWGRENIR